MKISFSLIYPLLLLVFAWMPRSLYAFPEAVRHGYLNCSVCHVSPSGGGMLTPYGRGLSREVISTWGSETEPMPLHGKVELPEGLRVGGGFRSAQTYLDTPRFRQGRYFLMQADLDLGWSTEHWTAVAAVGLDINSPDSRDDDEWVSPRHFVMVPIAENSSVRVGKFAFNYGLNIPNHTAQIKRGLGWSAGSETYNAELNLYSENYTLALTTVGGRPDDKDEDSEKGYAVNGQWLWLKANLRAGLSYFLGQTTSDVDREIFGPNIVWGVTKKIYLMGEYDVVRTAAPSSPLVAGFASFAKTGYEIFQGFDLTLSHETRKNDKNAGKLNLLGYGPGFSWAPRPHFVFSGEWQKQKRPQSSSATYDSAYFVAQYWF